MKTKQKTCIPHIVLFPYVVCHFRKPLTIMTVTNDHWRINSIYHSKRYHQNTSLWRKGNVSHPFVYYINYQLINPKYLRKNICVID